MEKESGKWRREWESRGVEGAREGILKGGHERNSSGKGHNAPVKDSGSEGGGEAAVAPCDEKGRAVITQGEWGSETALVDGEVGRTWKLLAAEGGTLDSSSKEGGPAGKRAKGGLKGVEGGEARISSLGGGAREGETVGVDAFSAVVSVSIVCG